MDKSQFGVVRTAAEERRRIDPEAEAREARERQAAQIRRFYPKKRQAEMLRRIGL